MAVETVEPYETKYGSIHRDIDFTTLDRCLKHGKPVPKWLQMKFDRRPGYYREAVATIREGRQGRALHGRGE